MIDKSKGKRAIEEFNAQMGEQIKAYIDPFVPLNIQHLHSHENFGLQIVDLFAYGTFVKHEHGDCEWFSVFEHKVLKNNILPQ